MFFLVLSGIASMSCRCMAPPPQLCYLSHGHGCCTLPQALSTSGCASVLHARVSPHDHTAIVLDCHDGRASLHLAVIWLLRKLDSFCKKFVFRFGCVLRTCVFPGGRAKALPKLLKSQNVWILSIVQWFYAFSLAKQNAKNTPDAFKHVPDLF